MKIDSILDLKIQDLKNNGITEVGYTKLTCINNGVYSTAYLFWSKENSTLIQKFENSEYDNNSIKKFKPIKIDDSTFFSYYNINKDELNKENIEHFEYKPDSIVGNKTYSSRIITSHSCFRHFVMKTDNENFHKQFDYFDLKEFDKKKVYASNLTKKEMKKWEERDWKMDSDTIYENHPIKNINFELNKSLKLVEWDKILTEFIEKLELENKFELIKTK